MEVAVTIILAAIVFLLTITAIVSMHSALRAGKELNAQIERVSVLQRRREVRALRAEMDRITEGRER